MFRWTITCLAIALIAAVLGFGGLMGSHMEVAKFVFLVFLVLAGASFFGGVMSNARLPG